MVAGRRKIPVRLILILLAAFSAAALIYRSPAKPAEPFLIVLGIAQDAGFPQSGCEKNCCREAWKDPSLRKKVTCLALIDPATGSAWMFEATPDFRDQLQLIKSLDRISPPELKGIFLTHGHTGHYTGLINLGREAMNTRQMPVYVMPRMEKFLTENGPWSQLVKLENIQPVKMTPDSSLLLGGKFSVKPFLVPHRDEFTETAGFEITGPRKKIIFIPDIDKWHKWDRRISEMVRQSDVLLLDGTFYRNGEVARDMQEIPHPFVEESMNEFSKLTGGKKHGYGSSILITPTRFCTRAVKKMKN